MPMALYEKIIRIREANNLTQQQLADRVFVTRQAVSKWERGLAYPSLDTLRLISREFGVSMNELLDVGQGKSEDYKPLGYKHFGFIVIYSAMFILVSGAIAAFNVLLIGTDTAWWAIAFYNALLSLIDLMIAFMLIQSIFPAHRVLVEYNDFGIRLKTFCGIKEIPFADIYSTEVRTHGNWLAGRLTVRVGERKFVAYPLKDPNRVKTVLDEIKALSR